MKINEDCINHNAVRLIKDLIEGRYETVEEEAADSNYLSLMLGRIYGIIEMADVMKEVLKA